MGCRGDVGPPLATAVEDVSANRAETNVPTAQPRRRRAERRTAPPARSRTAAPRRRASDEALPAPRLSGLVSDGAVVVAVGVPRGGPGAVGAGASGVAAGCRSRVDSAGPGRLDPAGLRPVVPTTTLPSMNGWNRQKYGNVPGRGKVRRYVLPEKSAPLSRNAPARRGVTVCCSGSSPTRHVTLSPARIRTTSGWNANPETEMVTLPAAAPSASYGQTADSDAARMPAAISVRVGRGILLGTLHGGGSDGGGPLWWLSRGSRRTSQRIEPTARCETNQPVSGEMARGRHTGRNGT
jgi:hypothetical protein